MTRSIRRFAALPILLTALMLADSARAGAPATGTVSAAQACAAYVSKNKRSNPGQVSLKVGESYQVFAVDRPATPFWYRIRVHGAHPPERWVSKRCVMGDVQVGDGSHGGGRAGTCNTAGLADSHVLALSWQPAFCETHREKPECRTDSSDAGQARHFTLHGLWPNKKACGTHYNYCGEIKSQSGHFCNYPMLDLRAAVRKELEEIMPSAAAGSCLQRHEWFKHGTCQTHWTIDGYFEHAVDLARQFNESGMAYFMSRNMGREISEQSFHERVDCALGADAHKRLQLRCRDGNLVDVYVNLPATLSKAESLGELMKRAEPKYSSNCGNSFRIDPVGYVN